MRIAVIRGLCALACALAFHAALVAVAVRLGWLAPDDATLPDTVPIVTATLTDGTALPNVASTVTANLTDGTAALTDSASTLPPTLLLHLLLAAYFVHLAVRTVYQTAARKPWLRSDGLNARGA